MSGANIRFLNDPVNFLNKHPVMPHPNLVNKVAPMDYGVVCVSLEQMDNAYLVTPAPSIPMAAATSLDSSAESIGFSAYFLRYKDLKSTVTKLGDKADYFFTDPLSGCTVSCGRGATPLIIHYNWKNDSGIDQTAIEHDIKARYMDAPRGAVRKDDYQSATDTSATVIGIRNPGTGIWNFLYQVYNSKDEVVKVSSF